MQPHQYIGKTLLVGLTYVDSSGTVTSRLQLHGTITRIAEHVLYFDRADGRGEFSLPAELDALEPGAEAVYTLASTGERVVNPDFVASWTIQAPAS